jgi:hypothetical protein
LSTAARARAKEIEHQVQQEMDEEDRKETVEEARRRKATNNANGLMVRRKVGKNKGVMDSGYTGWLSKIFRDENSDDSASS